MNHLRPHMHGGARSAGLGAARARRQRLRPLIAHTVDVRRIESGRGRYNIPNVGVFLWRLDAYPLSGSPAARVDDRRWRFHPLGIDQPLFTRPETEDEITASRDTAERAGSRSGGACSTPTRRLLHRQRRHRRKSLRLYDDSGGSLQPLVAAHVRCVQSFRRRRVLGACAAGRQQMRSIRRSGASRLPPGLPAGTRCASIFTTASAPDIGGGEYERAASFETADTPPQLVLVPDQFATIQAALDALDGAGVVEITDSGRYDETLGISANADQRVELRAANGHRPTLILGDEMSSRRGATPRSGSTACSIAGAGLGVPAAGGNQLRELESAHCTLVPGLALAPDCTPVSPSEASLIAEIA